MTLEELKVEALKFFLEECKKRVEARKMKLIPRKKNMDSIYKMGLTILLVEEIILELEIEDYLKGPEDDYNGSDEKIWMFLKKVEEYKVYIKIKLDANDCVVISFHEAEF